MNRAYRLVWNLRTLSWSVAPETATGRGKNGTRSLLVGAALLLAGASAGALPQGGQVSAGSGSIATPNAATLNVQQTSSRLAINWQSFGIGNGETVNFAQPGASAIALNRVLGTDGSAILGRLNANGQVFLINPNGVLFGAGAQVNVGGLVASTLNLSDNDFMAGRYTFGNAGTAGAASVVNLGNITAADGGYVALLGGQVSNQGAVQARLGTVALASGNQITLDFAGDGLLSVQVDKGAIGALAENKSLIQADGGQVFMSARAADSLVQAVVNNTGVIEARTLENRGGRIVLLADMANGTAQVGGTLDASAPNGGNGGFIETSGAHVKVADSAHITTAAAAGQTGTWLIDPNDFTVAASGGNITGTALSTQLGSNNVTIQTATQGTAGGNGDIFVNQAVSWSAGNKLTLDAERNIKVSADITASGNNAGLALKTGAAGKFTVEDPTNTGVMAKITLSGGNPSFSVNGNAYTVVQSLAQLQSINGSNLAGNYALGVDIDASSTAALNGGAGFKQLGSTSAGFTGTFDGLGHSITSLSIVRWTEDNVGLFGTIGTAGMVRQLLLVSPRVAGNTNVGTVAGLNQGTIERAFVYGSDAGGALVDGTTNVGGVAGRVDGTVSLGTLARVFVNGVNTVGGLVGYLGEGGLVTDSSAARVITGVSNVGGLVGYAYKSSILNSRYQGTLVTGTSNVGGIAGAIEQGTIDSVRTTASTSGGVTTQGEIVGQQRVGGIVGDASGSLVSHITSNDSVNGVAMVGGLVGSLHDGSTLSNGTSNGTVAAQSASADVFSIGGAVGSAANSTVQYITAVGTVTATQSSPFANSIASVGGSIGSATNTTIAHMKATGAVSATQSGESAGSTTSVGGFIGSGTNVSIDDSSATGNVAVTTGQGYFGFSFSFGGFAGAIAWTPTSGYSVSNSRSDGSVTVSGPYNSQAIGGFVGSLSNASLDHVVANGSVDTRGAQSVNAVGGLVGRSNDSIITNYGVNGNVTLGDGGFYIGGVVGSIDGGSIGGTTWAGTLVATGNADTIGGFAGGIANTTVSDVHVIGTLTLGAGSSRVGGVVGALRFASVNSSSATANISGSNNLGGLVGQASASTISGSTSSGNVTGFGNAIGGLVGTVEGNYSQTYDPVSGVATSIGHADTIVGSTASGDVSGYSKVGGLIGQISGPELPDGTTSPMRASISGGSQATGDVRGTVDVGGLVGSAKLVDISASGATGAVGGTYSIGGLIGTATNVTLSEVSASGAVTAGDGASAVGGLIGGGGTVTLSAATASGAVVVGSNVAYVGGLAGRFDGGSIDGAHHTGALSVGDGSGYVGGLVGDLRMATLSNSSATGNVNGSDYLGGLVGYAFGSTISDSTASGKVTQGSGSHAGGLVGRLESTYRLEYNNTTNQYDYVGVSAQVLRSSASGDVSGVSSVGGLVGSVVGITYSDAVSSHTALGVVAGSQATGNVSGNNDVGGLVGSASGATLSNATSSGNVTAQSDNASVYSIGGAIGVASDSTVQHVTATGAVSVTQTGNGYVTASEVGGLIGSGTNVSIDDSTATGNVTVTTSSVYYSSGIGGFGGFAGALTGSISNSRSDGSVIVASGPYYIERVGGFVGSLTGSLDHVTANGSVDIDGSSSIFSNYVGGLVGQATSSTISNYSVNGNVTLSSGTYVGGVIGSIDGGSIGGGAFSGELTVTGGATYGGGFAGEIRNVSVSGVHATGTMTVGADSNYVGGLAGSLSFASVSDSSATTNVSGVSYVGGLVGQAYASTISGSKASGNVTGTGSDIGGLVGGATSATTQIYNPTTEAYENVVVVSRIVDSSASGSVTGTTNVGGLVGSISGTYADDAASGKAIVSNAYSTGTVTGSSSVGGLVGHAASVALSDVSATGAVSAGDGAYAVGGLLGHATRVSLDTYTAPVSVTAGKGSNYVGGLVGTAVEMSIDGYTAAGSVTVGDDSNYVGGLAGQFGSGSIDNVHLTGTVSTGVGTSYVGGLVGLLETSTLSHSSAAANISGRTYVGGLVGSASGATLSDATSTGNVTAQSDNANVYSIGGAVGGATDSTIQHVKATGAVSVNQSENNDYYYTSDVGGLIGSGTNVSIDDSIATGNVTVATSSVYYSSGAGGFGGFAGALTGSISNSRSDGSVIVASGPYYIERVGGFVGSLTGSLDHVTANGSVDIDGSSSIFSNYVGGLVGQATSSTISNYSVNGNVTLSSGTYVGGVIGSIDGGSIGGGTFSGELTVTGGATYGGGFAGEIRNVSVSGVHATGTMTVGADSNYVGGLAGSLSFASVSDSSATTNVSGVSYVGGLVGQAYASTIGGSTASGNVTGTGSDIGGLVGGATSATTQIYNPTTEAYENVVVVSRIVDSSASGNVAGSSNVGGLVGSISGTYADDAVSGKAIVSNAYSMGAVTGSGSVGGLVGYSSMATISNSSAQGNVAVANVPSYASGFGGLLGSASDVQVVGSTAAGNVSALGDQIYGGGSVGGLAGSLAGGSVTNSSASGSVVVGNGMDGVGGLVGDASGVTVSGYQASGNVTAGDSSISVGGLAGRFSNGSISDTHATGTVKTGEGSNNVGGLVGTLSYSTVSNSSATSNISGASNLGGLVGQANYSTISGSTASGNVAGTASNIGGLVGDVSSTYTTYNDPVTDEVRFLGLPGQVLNSSASGAVSGSTNVGGLVGQLVGAAYYDYSLMVNVDNSAVVANSHATGSVNAGFASYSSSVGGLVGDARGAAVSDSTATGSVSGFYAVGGLIGGQLLGSVDRSYATGDVVGSNSVGGLVGYSAGGMLDQTWAAGAVSGTYNVGGLVGSALEGQIWDVTISGPRPRGHISQSYASGAVTGVTDPNISTTTWSIGGLVGESTLAIDHSYASGKVTTSDVNDSTGGLVGRQYNEGRVLSSYWNADSTGQISGIGRADNIDTVSNTLTGLTQAMSLNAASYSGWDLAGVWRIYDGYTAPLLRTFMTSLVVTVNDARKTYDGTLWSGGNGLSYSVAGASLLGTATYGGTAQGARNAGSYTLDVSGLYSTQLGYDVTSIVKGTLTVDKRQLVLAATAQDKVYDATTAVTGYTYTDDRVTGDTLNFATTAAFDNKNVGTDKLVTVSVQTVTGADAQNYIVDAKYFAQADVTPKAITGTISADNKVYDATTAAITHGNLTGVFANDVVNLATSGSFSDKNAGLQKTVTVGGALAGTDAGNYTVTSNATALADITPKGIAGTIVADNKVYDGNTSATTHGSLNGVIGTDQVDLSTSGAFANKNAVVGKTVTVAGTLTGTDAGNYAVTNNATTTATIDRKAIEGAIVAAGKTYDGTVAAATSGTLNGLVTDDVVTLSTTGTFADKNAGTAKLVNVNGSLAGKDAGNYTVSSNATTSADIDRKLIAGAIAAQNKTYDGTVAATTSGTLSDLVAGDKVALDTSGTFGDKNAGVGKIVTVSGTLSGADAANYVVMSNGTATADIAQRALTGTIVADGKTYDRSTDATTSGTLSNTVAGDDIRLNTQGSFADWNAGLAKVVNVGGTLGGTDAGNYTVTSNATTTADIARRVLAFTNITADDKVYDATTTATVSATLSGVLQGDAVTAVATGGFSDKNVGTGKTVSITGSLGGADAANYAASTTTTATADITARGITGTIVAAGKTYDGTTAAVTTGSLSGVLGTDGVTLSTTGAFGDKNAGQSKTVNVAGTLAGTDAGNYTVISNATTTADIAQKAITGVIVANNKVYDGSIDATTSGTLQGAISGDTVSLTTTGSFGNKNAGIGKTVNVQGELAGADALNYKVQSNATTVADIARRQLAFTDVAASDKVYDATTAATVSAALDGVIAGDVVTVAASGSFADKNVGKAKVVTVSGSLGGADAANYLASTTTTATADISAKAISGAITAANKTYDGTTAAATTGSLDGVIAGDGVTFATNGSFGDKNAATGKTVTVSGALAGTDAGNYLVSSNSTTTADIAKKAISGAIVADNKTYDGTTAATTSGTLSGTIVGDNIGLSTNGSFGDKNAGVGKTVTVSGALTGADSGNYLVSSNATTTADIAKKAISGAIVADNKIYDGTTAATTSGSLSGTIVGDNIGLSTIGSFSDKNAAAGKTVTVAGMLSGTDAGNYAVSSNATTTADIAKKAITGAIAADSKVYDGTTTAATSGTLGGTIVGDSIGLSTSGNFSDKNAAVGKTVTVVGTLSGGDAGNYTVTSNATTTADITQKAITGAIVAANKTYDGNVAANTTGSLSGTVVGDDIALATSGSFSDKNAATGKTVAVNGTLTGTDAGNYVVSNNATAKADILKKAISGAIVADNKVYDGTTAATTSGALSGTIVGDDIGLSTNGNFSDKNAAVGKTVTVAGTLTGMDAGNYAVTSNATTTADIAKKAITGVIVADNKVYDGTTSATTSGSLSGTIVGDAIGLSTTGSFSDKNAATGKTVTVAGALSGTDAGNYTATSNTTTTANIAQKAITGAIVADNKVYDGTTAATTSGTLSGTIVGDNIGLATTGSFGDKNAAAGKTVTVSGDLTGADAGNYLVSNNATTKADILQKAINGAIVAANKTYDGTAAAITSGTVSGTIVGDDIGLATTGSFSDKNAATGKIVTVAGTLTGADAGNYAVSSNATTTADIAQKAIGGTIVAANKTYDGTRVATTTGNLSGTIGGDSIALATTGSFSDKNAATGKTVMVAGTLTGTDAGNYAVTSNATTTADIAQKAITGTIVAANKTYDGTTAATTSGTLGGTIVGDAIGLATSGSFGDKNAATGKTVNVSGELTGADAGNYVVSNNTTAKADILQKAVSGAIVADNKVYDGTTAAVTSGTLSGTIGGDDIGLATTGSFRDKNAATGKTVTVAGTLSGTDAGNYAVTSNATTTADIAKKAIGGAIVADNKVYDGTTSATTSGSLSGTIVGDAIGLSTTGSFSDKSAAVNKTVTVAGTLSGADAGNYLVSNNTTTTADIAQKAITGAIVADNKVYDGTTAATTSGTLSGTIVGDSIGLSTSGSFGDKNAATGKTVTVAGTLSGADAGNYAVTSNATTTADIAKKAISGAIAADNKVYDGTTVAITSGTLSGTIVGDAIGLATTGSFADKNAAAGKTVTVAGTLTGTDAGNYAVSSNATTTADIAKKAIAGTIVAANKSYDGTTAAITSGTLSGTIVGDAIGLATTGSFADKNAATGKTVTVGGALTGIDAGNYAVTSNATTTADIAKKAIAGTIVAANKTYDGTTAATTSGSLSGTIVGDAIGLATSGSFGDKNAATGKTVTVAGTLSGADAGNYAVTSNATTTADIAKKAIGGAIVAANKTYDGTTAATTSGSLSGTIVGDSIGLSTSGSFSDKNAATGKTVTVAGTLTGTDAGNYAVTSNATTTADIARKAISGAIVASDKVYDGTATATTSGTLSGAVNGDVVSLSTSGSFADKNAATGKTVTVGGALSGTDAGNYTVTSNATTTASITPKAVTGAITAADKVYDGTTAATTSGSLSGTIAGDAIGLATSGSFADKNAAVGKTVTVAGTLAGADAGNYTVTSNATATADIARKALSYATLNAVDKVYDGTTSVAVSASLGGVVSGDAVTVATSGAFVDRNAGTDKAVGVTGTLAGADAANYTLAAGSTTADIAAKALTVTANDASKTFDGTAYQGGNGVTVTGLVAGDTAAGLGTVSYGGSAQGAVQPGNYVLTAGGLRNTNYAISYTAGRLSIDGVSFAVDELFLEARSGALTQLIDRLQVIKQACTADNCWRAEYDAVLDRLMEQARQLAPQQVSALR